MALLFHVTPARNLASIRIDGLVPQVGARANDAGEANPRIWAFPTIAHAEDALLNWLGDALEDEEGCLALIEVDVPDADVVSGAGFEVEIARPVPARHIRVITENLDADGFPATGLSCGG